MVTVIPTNEELTTPVNNGVTGADSSDNERLFQLIKDYQEVDFHRSPSCKPLPEDILSKTLIKGTFFVQIDSIEPFFNQKEQNNDQILLTLTDGITTVTAITNDHIPNLNFNIKSGSKLLLNDSISIIDGLLQITQDNTRFQYGSNTYPRPRSAHRGRGSGFNRRTNRYDTDDGETKILKRPPPKNTLMDFMTTLKISNDTETEKPKERPRRPNEATNPSYYNEQIFFQQDGIDEQLDPEDDPSHVNYRERRNPLPPRLQRVQEERSRRNTNRYYDENDQSSSLYIRHGDQTSFGQQFAGVNGSTPSHLTYFPTNPNPLTYIPSPTYHNQQQLIASSYPNDHITFCYGPTYLPPTIGNGFNGDAKLHANISSDNENTIENDENNDSGIKLESSTDYQEEKRRDSNPRPRWRIGDMCLARWSEDGEFYYATITDIQPPYCTVIFRDYNNYDQVHFGDLKIIPRDQQFVQYPFIPPSSDLNILAPNVYYPPRTSYYPPTIIMPEAPPFPFNSAGTLYIYPPALTSLSRSNGYQQEIPRNEYINSSSSPSKDSNDTSGVDSTTISSNEQDTSLPRPCSIADAPLTLVTSDDLRERSTSTESLTSSKYDEQQSIKEEEETRE